LLLLVPLLLLSPLLHRLMERLVLLLLLLLLLLLPVRQLILQQLLQLALYAPAAAAATRRGGCAHTRPDCRPPNRCGRCRLGRRRCSLWRRFTRPFGGGLCRGHGGWLEARCCRLDRGWLGQNRIIHSGAVAVCTIRRRRRCICVHRSR
jgi:hypothetical protein